MRLQKAPRGAPLDLVPRFMGVPLSETYALQLIYRINIASADQTKVVPEWVPIVHEAATVSEVIAQPAIGAGEGPE
jgi:hypothetical protein